MSITHSTETYTNVVGRRVHTPSRGADARMKRHMCHCRVCVRAFQDRWCDGCDNGWHDRLPHEAYDEWRHRFCDGFDDDCDDSLDDEICDGFERNSARVVPRLTAV